MKRPWTVLVLVGPSNPWLGLAWLGSLLSITTDKFGDMMSTILGKVYLYLNNKSESVLFLALEY